MPDINDFEERARKASREDYNQASLYRRETFKFVITLNSGAALADLAFLSNIADDLLVSSPPAFSARVAAFAAFGLIIFVLGASAGVGASRAMARHRQTYGYHWDRASTGASGKELAQIAEEGGRAMKWSERLQRLAVILFVAGASIVVAPFLLIA